MFESLESRVHLHAVVTSDSFGPYIYVPGFAGIVDDTIQITQSGDTITVLHTAGVQSETDTFSVANTGVNKVVVDAGDGNDTVRFQTTALTNKLQLPGVVNLGNGNDNFLGSVGGDTV